MREVRRAGEQLAGKLIWTDSSAPEIRHAFRVANSWRAAHEYPMRSIRAQLGAYVRYFSQDALFPVARLKRMQAIRGKLGRVGLKLDQLQDLGGCRVILDDCQDVYRLVETIESRSRHSLRRVNDYIDEPRASGYRSYHLIFEYNGLGAAEVHLGRRIEVQIRSSLQHAWSTAVEAIGTVRGEELKSGRGNADWLRLLLLMSAEMAELEGYPTPPQSSEGRLRIKEIQDLSRKLNALEALQNIRFASRYAEDAYQIEKPVYYLIKYNNETAEVQIEPVFTTKSAVQSYDRAESRDNEADTEKENIVLVEADKVESLNAAFPNYFGDVAPFRDLLEKVVTNGVGLAAFHLRLQERASVSPKPKEKADLAWFKRRLRWR